MRRPFDIATVVVGVAGIISVVANVWGFLEVVNSPGDDNPMGMVLFVVAAMSLLPVSGPLWVKHTPLIVRVLWLGASLVPLSLTAVIFFAMFSR